MLKQDITCKYKLSNTTLPRDRIYDATTLNIARRIRMKSNNGELSNVGDVNVDGDTVHIVLEDRFETK
jgi:hypothetical protein